MLSEICFLRTLVTREVQYLPGTYTEPTNTMDLEPHTLTRITLHLTFLTLNPWR